jgi:hypothetical protein
MRNRMLVRSTTPVFLTSAVLIGLFITLQALTMSGAQVVDRDFGRFESKVELSAIAGFDSTTPRAQEDMEAAVRGAGAVEVTTTLTSYDIEPAITAPPATLYVETDWTANPFPQRYSLKDGRWPSAPGEIVLTEAGRVMMPGDGVLPVLSGSQHLRIVGTASDRFSAWATILAAPRTWAGMDPAGRPDRAKPSAFTSLFWNGAIQEQAVSAIEKVITGNSLGRGPDDDRPEIAGLVAGRQDTAAHGPPSWVERFPLAYRLPALALPLLSVLAVFGLNRQRSQRIITVFTSLGIPRPAAVGGMALATSAWTTISFSFGAVAGAGLGWIARHAVADLRIEPLSPFPGLLVPGLELLAVVVGGCLLATVLLRPWSRAPSAPDVAAEEAVHSTANWGRKVRRGFALVAACAVVYQVNTLVSIKDAMVLAGLLGTTVLLVTPELVNAVISRLPENGPRRRLALRQLSVHRSRGITATAVLTATIGAPLALLTLLATYTATETSRFQLDAAPHQVVLTGLGSTAEVPLPEVVDAVTRRVDFADPAIHLRYLMDANVAVSVRGEDLGGVLAIDTPDEVARLTGRPLSQVESDTLRRGGILVWSDNGRTDRTLVSVAVADGKAMTASRPIPATVSDFEPAWKASVHGVLLTGSAHELGLPVSDGAVVYTDVADVDVTAAQQAVLDAGLSRRFIKVYEPPEPVFVPATFYTAIVGLALVALLTTVGVTRAQVFTLRTYLTRLVAIGLPPSWARQVIVMESTVVVCLSTVLGLTVALPTVVVTTHQIDGLVLDVPWLDLGLVIAAFILTTAGATLVASRRLRVTKRKTEHVRQNKRPWRRLKAQRA